MVIDHFWSIILHQTILYLLCQINLYYKIDDINEKIETSI